VIILHIITSIFRFVAYSWTARRRWRIRAPCTSLRCPVS